MDRLHAFRRQLHSYLFIAIFGFGLVLVGALYLGNYLFPDQTILVYGSVLIVSVLLASVLAASLAGYASRPVEFVWRAIVHVLPNGSSVPAPNLEQNRVAKELVSSMVMQVYQLASNGHQLGNKAPAPSQDVLQAVTQNFPLPVVAIDKDQSIIFINDAMLQYVGAKREQLLHQNFYSLFDLAFSDSNTVDGWLQNCRKNKATDNHTWQRVRLKLADDQLKQFDLAASYSKENPTGAEMVLTMFDQTQRYQTDDQALDFIALAVHELRTPLTALQGYIEVFDDEFSGKLDPELTDFMHKMRVSARQLTTFVNNVLQVARLEEGQLFLQLTSESWQPVVNSVIQSVQPQAKARGITIQSNVPADLPAVGIDKVTMSEVLNNLLDNAIKYSGTGKRIVVTSKLTNENLIETTVTDDGVGIPSSVIPHLFEKFQRNHRNQAKIGGTGLGLYLCSAIVQAHGGHIWVKSKEGQGTAIGFTVQPYSAVADSQKDSHNKDITRNAHGWIKNHSLYRR